MRLEMDPAEWREMYEQFDSGEPLDIDLVEEDGRTIPGTGVNMASYPVIIVEHDAVTEL